jgi:hypothetical protein
MTDSLPSVVISYERFLEYRNRHRGVAPVSPAPARPPAIEPPETPASTLTLPRPDVESRT